MGLVQGLTEFIPVSSSGHLVLVRNVLGLVGGDALSVDAVLQLATILAVGVYFFKDFVSLHKDKTTLYAIIIGTIPALVLGLLLESKMETVFRSSYLVAWTLLFGSILMYLAERLAKQNQIITPRRGIVVGFFQALALIPGVSRSGATISGGLLAGLTRESATRFSFMLSFPIILGSGLMKFVELGQSGGLSSIGLPIVVACIVAFVSGLGAIHFLIRYLKNHKLTLFIWYRVLLAGVVLLLV